MESRLSGASAFEKGVRDSVFSEVSYGAGHIKK